MSQIPGQILYQVWLTEFLNHNYTSESENKTRKSEERKRKGSGPASAVSEHSHAHLNFHGRRVTSELREGYISSLKLILRGSLPVQKRGRGTSQTGWTWLKKELQTCGHLNRTPKAKGKEKRPRGREGVPQPGAEQSIPGARDSRGVGS